MCDQDLVQRVLAGDRDAFAELVDRHHRVVVAAALAITRDRELARDIGQDAFILAWQRLGSLDDRARVGPWIAGIARNLAKSAARKRARRDAVALEDGRAALPAPDEQLGDREVQALLLCALGDLPVAQREALILYYFEDRSVEQVAIGLGITPNVAKQRLFRAREATRVRLTARLETALETMRPSAAFVATVIAAIAVGAVTDAAAATTSVATRATKGSSMLLSKFAIAAAALAVAGGGALFATTRSHPDVPRDERLPGARVVSPSEHAELASAIASAQARRNGMAAPALPTVPAHRIPRAAPDVLHCSTSSSDCERDYLIGVAIKVGQALQASCPALRDFRGAVQIHASIATEPEAGAIFTSVELEDQPRDDMTKLFQGAEATGEVRHVQLQGSPTWKIDSTEDLSAQVNALLAAQGSDAKTIVLDSDAPTEASVRNGLVLGLPKLDEHATASPELRECLISSLYAMELEPAASPGPLTTDLIVTGSTYFAFATPEKL